MFSNEKVDFNKKPCDNDVVVITTTNKSSSAAELAASSNRLGPHGSVQVLTIISHHQLSSTAADDDLLELKLAQTHVALIGLTRQQVLQLMMTCYSCLIKIKF